MPAGKQDLEQELRELEERFLQPDNRRDPQSLAALLADEFCEFGSSGRIFGKDEILKLLQEESPAQFSISHFHLRTSSAGIALVTYRVQRGQPASQSLRSSVWVMRNGRWQMLFHQGTRIGA